MMINPTKIIMMINNVDSESIMSIPVELLIKISTFLYNHDLSSIKRSCRKFYTVYKNINSISKECSLTVNKNISYKRWHGIRHILVCKHCESKMWIKTKTSYNKRTDREETRRIAINSRCGLIRKIFTGQIEKIHYQFFDVPQMTSYLGDDLIGTMHILTLRHPQVYVDMCIDNKECHNAIKKWMMRANIKCDSLCLITRESIYPKLMIR